MTDSTDTTTAADTAKDVAVEVTKEVAITVAGVVIAGVLLGGYNTVATKLRARKAEKSESAATAI